jgi:serine/threonine protein kinase
MGGELETGQNNTSNTSNLNIPIKCNLSRAATVNSRSPKRNKQPEGYKMIGRFSVRQFGRKNKTDSELINNSIEKNFFFRNLKINERKDIIDNMSLSNFKPNSIIYSIGSIPSCWYIVNKGDLELWSANKKIKELKKGDSFGEVALINNTYQTSTVKAINDCELWGLSKEFFDKVKNVLLNNSHKEISDFLKTLILPMKDNIKTEMADFLVKNIYKQNEVICYESETIPCVYIIKDGEVNVCKNNTILKTYKRKEFFGEEGLFEGYKNTADIIAKSNCTIYSISNDFFYSRLGKGKDFKNQLYFTLLKIIFSKSSNFYKISSRLNNIFDEFQFKTFKTNITVYRKGTDLSRKMCIILSGNLIEKDGAMIATKNEILFEKELYKENQIIVPNDLCGDSYCVIAEVNYEDIKRELDKSKTIDNHNNNINTHFISNNNNNNNTNLNTNNNSIHYSKTNNNNNSIPKKNNVLRYCKTVSENNNNHHSNIINKNNINTVNNNNINTVNNNNNIHYNTISNSNSNQYSFNYNKIPVLNRIKSDIGIRNYFISEPLDRKEHSLKVLSLRKKSNSPKINFGDNSFNDKKNRINFTFDSKFRTSKTQEINSIPFSKNYTFGMRDNLSPSRGGGAKFSRTLTETGMVNRCKILRMDHTLNTSNNSIGKVFTIPEEIRTHNISIEEINNINIFKKLDDSKKRLLQNNLEIEKYNNGVNIIEQGKKGNNLYVIKSGDVDFFLNTKYIKTKHKGDNFGYDSLITNNKTNLETVTAKGQVECYTLTREIFNKILNKELKEYFLNRFYLNDYSIELEDLEYVKSLGEGSYGFVNLVRNIKNKHLYAAKAIYLKQIKEENILLRTECERDLLLKMDHPFIAKCVKFLKHDVYLLYLMEYVRGKEMFDIMREINLFNKNQTQFYAASMLEVINYLHIHKIIYRDLKPENVMIIENGYVKFIDFGTVKELKDKTKTFLGTYSYMAPEIFDGNGYSFQVDIWALGVILYEFVCGKLPFGDDFDDEENPMKFYNVLMKENLKFPSFIKDENFKDLIQKMLVKETSKRLYQYQKIREHPYFKDFEWDKLLSLELPGPYTYKLHNVINKNKKPKPYLDYLKGLNRRPYFKKMVSNRQIRFQKWYDNF